MNGYWVKSDKESKEAGQKTEEKPQVQQESVPQNVTDKKNEVDNMEL